MEQDMFKFKHLLKKIEYSSLNRWIFNILQINFFFISYIIVLISDSNICNIRFFFFVF